MKSCGIFSYAYLKNHLWPIVQLFKTNDIISKYDIIVSIGRYEKLFIA